MKMRAVFNGAVLAESDDTKVVEGNHYFPPESINQEYFTGTKMKTLCYWKGMASYYTIEVDGVSNENGAWYYPKPSPLARKIKNHVAFGYGIETTSTG